MERESEGSYQAISMMMVDGSLQGMDGEDRWSEKIIRLSAANKKRNFSEAENDFEELYFSTDPTYSEGDFELRFRMKRSLFERITDPLIIQGIFVQRTDIERNRGISPRMRITVSLRVLSYGK